MFLHFRRELARPEKQKTNKNKKQTKNKKMKNEELAFFQKFLSYFGMTADQAVK